MANFTESDTFNANITQIDNGERITGGASGIANRALSELVNRSRYLYNNDLTLRKSNLSASSSHTIDCSNDNKWIYIPITSNTTINLTNVDTGLITYLELQGAGSYTITWQCEGNSSNIVWDNATEPTWASGTAKSLVCFCSPDGTKLYGNRILENIA